MPATRFVDYLCTQVLPVLDRLAKQQSGLDLSFLQLLAEMSKYIVPTPEKINIEQCHGVVFKKLIEFMPPPPEDLSESAPAASANLDEPTLHLSHVESLLYTFHQFGKHNSGFLDAVADRQKDFKLRLQYLARGVQNYITKLKKALAAIKRVKGNEALKSEENKMKLTALKTTTNINVLIKDLFKIPPSYKADIHLSWKTASPTKGPALSRLPSIEPPVDIATTNPTVAAKNGTTTPAVRNIYKDYFFAIYF